GHGNHTKPNGGGGSGSGAGTGSETNPSDPDNPENLTVNPDTKMSTSDPAMSDCNVLLDFWHSTNGNLWTDNVGWGNITIEAGGGWGCCAYANSVGADGVVQNGGGGLFGVVCDSMGRVNSLSFGPNNLVGTLPSSISNLDKLKILNISGNPGLSGTIPNGVFSMPNLQTLVLSQNNLSGILTYALSNLTAPLDTLDLIHAVVIKIPFSNESLSKGDNKFTGALYALDAGTTFTACTLVHNSFTCVESTFDQNICPVDSWTMSCGTNGTQPLPPRPARSPRVNPSVTKNDGSTRLALIMGLTASFLVVVGVIVGGVAIVYWRRRRLRHDADGGYDDDDFAGLSEEEQARREREKERERDRIRREGLIGIGSGGGSGTGSPDGEDGDYDEPRSNWWEEELEVDRVAKVGVAATGVVVLGGKYEVILEYIPPVTHDGSGHLFLEKGQIVLVDAVLESGLCIGYNLDTGVRGMFPATCLRPVENDKTLVGKRSIVTLPPASLTRATSE
ncbi:hypothetical protein HDU76_005882, partial [Blyttiomyces sp. JEL0837]